MPTTHLLHNEQIWTWEGSCTVRSKLNKFEHVWVEGGSLHSEVQWLMGNAHMGPPVEIQTQLKTLPSPMECRAVYWLCIRSTLSAKLIKFLICFYVYFQFWKFHEGSFSSQGKFTAFYKITKKVKEIPANFWSVRENWISKYFVMLLSHISVLDTFED